MLYKDCMAVLYIALYISVTAYREKPNISMDQTSK